MTRRLIEAFLTVTVIVLMSYSALADRHDELFQECRNLYQKQEFSAALNLLEPEMEKGPINSFYAWPFRSPEEFMGALYVESKQIDRGVKFFRRIFEKEKHGRIKDYYGLSIALFELAMLNGNFDLATEAAQSPSEFSEREFKIARVYAAQGRTHDALRMLRLQLTQVARGYLHPSQTEMLVYPEFRSLYTNVEFREMMTDSRERFQERISNLFSSRRDNQDLKNARISVEAIKEAAEVYKKVPDPSSVDGLYKQLNEADQEIRSSLSSYKASAAGAENVREKLLSLLRNEKTSAYYRLTLAGILASLDDPEMTKKVAEEVANDNFLQFPSQFARLTYMVARSAPQSARPLLMQMLKGGGGSVPLPQHAMVLGWEHLLFFAFGVAESEYTDDLLRIAETGSALESKNATTVLLAFQEPRLVPILRKRILNDKDAGNRKEMVNQLGNLMLPQAAAAFEGLKHDLGVKYNDDTEEIAMIAAQIKPLKPIPNFRVCPAVAIQDEAIKEILFNNLEYSNGGDVSFVDSSIAATATKSDLPKLLRIRSAILNRISDEAMHDYGSITRIIVGLYWQN